MIRLHQFYPVWTLTTASSFCLKLETYLRMVGHPYEVVVEMDPRKAPLGKLPYIEDGGQTLVDSGLIVDYLKTKYGDSLDRRPFDGTARRGTGATADGRGKPILVLDVFAVDRRCRLAAP